MTKNNMYFYLLIVAGFAITSIMFFSWNYSPTSSIENNGQILNRESFNIDGCSLSNGYISIKGWAYLQNRGRVISNIYAEKEDGRFIKINKSAFHVLGINERMALSNYELPGFFGVKRILGWEHFSGKFIIKLEDQQGNTYHEEYTCKQI